jgi:hypothetical protein
VKDRVDKKEVCIQYCPTEQMLADFFTKPLQGSLFKLFRDVIMGYQPITDLYTIVDTSVKERVEKTNFKNETNESKTDITRKLT